MNTLHLTTAPRLAMRSVKDPITGERTLEASIDTETGLQDVNVAGTLVSINPEPITYIRKSDGSEGTAYQGKSKIADHTGKEAIVNVLVNGSAIADVVVGQTYWLTERENPGYTTPNYSQGSLQVESMSNEGALARRAMLMSQAAKVAAEAAKASATADVEQE